VVTGASPYPRRKADSHGATLAFLSHRERIKVREMKLQQARYLRKKATDAEKRLWSHLKNRQLAGLKFRRQHPIEDRIVDFFCAEAKLAIELDGSGHTGYLAKTSDLDRELELYEKGIRVLRFHNRDVLKNLDSILNAIIHAVDPEKSLWPSSNQPSQD
jgi:very-short-patch-repair endonuclease